MVLGGCAIAPTAPTVMVLPGTQKNPAQFQADHLACQQEAQARLAPATEAANNQAASNVVIGTVLGAAVGALLGQGSYNPGAVAAWGAGTGGNGACAPDGTISAMVKRLAMMNLRMPGPYFFGAECGSGQRLPQATFGAKNPGFAGFRGFSNTNDHVQRNAFIRFKFNFIPDGYNWIEYRTLPA